MNIVVVAQNDNDMIVAYGSVVYLNLLATLNVTLLK